MHQPARDRTTLLGRDFIETLDWTVEEIDETLAVAANGSMGPKVAAACRFVEATGGTAAIGAFEDAARIVSGTAGTIVARDATRRVA